MVEELIPITYHLSIEIFERDRELVSIRDKPKHLMLIGDGICDVIWRPLLSPRNLKPRNSFQKNSAVSEIDNPLQKFSESLHKIMISNKSQKSAIEIDNPTSEGFKVQRLMRGDALTVRALSSKISHKPSQMKIVASSKTVKVFKLERSNLQYLPENIRVDSVSSVRVGVREQPLL